MPRGLRDLRFPDQGSRSESAQSSPLHRQGSPQNCMYLNKVYNITWQVQGLQA